MTAGPSALALPPSVTLGPGAGGLPAITVLGPAASATIYLQGAHLTSWSPAGHGSVLWMSSASHYAAGTPLRGGVPICFPWFGAHGTDAAAPAHGFARRVGWQLAGAEEVDGRVELSLRLTDTEESRSGPWPCRFEAILSISVGTTLVLSLTVTNQDSTELSFEEAFHTYLRVGDVRECALGGLEASPFFDRTQASGELRTEPGQVRFDGEVDRLYVDNTTATLVLDKSEKRSTRVDKAGSADTVVWSPGPAVAARMSDVGQGEWLGMVCVETCNVGRSAVNLAPGERHTMTATFEVNG